MNRCFLKGQEVTLFKLDLFKMKIWFYAHLAIGLPSFVWSGFTCWIANLNLGETTRERRRKVGKGEDLSRGWSVYLKHNSIFSLPLQLKVQHCRVSSVASALKHFISYFWNNLLIPLISRKNNTSLAYWTPLWARQSRCHLKCFIFSSRTKYKPGSNTPLYKPLKLFKYLQKIENKT